MYTVFSYPFSYHYWHFMMNERIERVKIRVPGQSPTPPGLAYKDNPYIIFQTQTMALDSHRKGNIKDWILGCKRAVWTQWCTSVFIQTVHIHTVKHITPYGYVLPVVFGPFLFISKWICFKLQNRAFRVIQQYEHHIYLESSHQEQSFKK